ncbi:MAG: FAD-dependent oxidoreductase [Micropruina sp.]|nr:FAD-dependent oxidoreductase [Micropruina sp.]
MSRWLPGRDRRAVRHPGPTGRARVQQPRRVIVVGGGIAGLAAATVLAERGVSVHVVEAQPQLGGRVRAWPVAGGRTMSRGFHAFFRQYYNLRNLLRRTDPTLSRLRPIEDYPLQRPDGLRDSFSSIPRTPPWSVLGFVVQSPTFTPRALAGVDVKAALELLQVSFPRSFSDYDGESAAAFLDRLRFPPAARDLALEVFARSFFADPSEFGAGELVAMFHTYFMGSAEGLTFDVPHDDYDTALWAPLGRHLGKLGVTIATNTRVERISAEGRVGVQVEGQFLEADAVVLATDPRAARALIAEVEVSTPAEPWQQRVAATRNSPPFAVLRLWLDGLVAPDRPEFLGTSGYGPLDNISVLDRFEEGARQWRRQHQGSVVELHAYATSPAVMDDPAAAASVREQLLTELHRAYPETESMGIVAEEFVVADDCVLIDPSPWQQRPGVITPYPALTLTGDWVRCDFPVALMERAATTGMLAANTLLARWDTAGEDLWTVPMRGLLGRRGARTT